MIWNIVTDSSCDLHRLDLNFGDNIINYYSVPFVISAGNKDYIDDENIAIDEMLDTMEREEKASHTSCPSPASWMDFFEKEGNIIAITISKELSGSYNSACVAREMILDEHPDRAIVVINSVSAGAGLIVLLRKICQNIQKGMDFQNVASQAERDTRLMRTIFALASFNNLVKNGRMSPVTGFIARKLGFWGIGIGSSEGRIEIKGKVRGAKKALYSILEDIKERGKPVKYVAISHCQNLELAERMKKEISACWSDICVEIHEMRGLCSYYAERHGIIVAYA